MAGEAYTQYSVKYLVFFDTKSLLSHLEAKEVRSVGVELDTPLSLKGVYKQYKIQMSDNNRVSSWDLYFSVSSSTLVDKDTTCILGEFVDQTNIGRVTDTRIGSVCSE